MLSDQLRVVLAQECLVHYPNLRCRLLVPLPRSCHSGACEGWVDLEELPRARVAKGAEKLMLGTESIGIEALKAVAFDAAIESASKRIEAARRQQGDAASRRVATREGVRLLLERFYSPSALQLEASSAAPAPGGASLSRRGSATDDAASASLSDYYGEIAASLAASLLTTQAEGRVREGVVGFTFNDEAHWELFAEAVWAADRDADSASFETMLAELDVKGAVVEA